MCLERKVGAEYVIEVRRRGCERRDLIFIQTSQARTRSET
jgi:hypothetical protein